MTEQKDNERAPCGAGNMREVYLGVVRQAEATARYVDERRGPLNAEIIEGQTALWHVLRVEPAAERIAAAHLVGRRFGVYLPEFDKKLQPTAFRPARTERRCLFPGYLFIFVWNVLAHRRRIYACPGVLRLLYDGDRPAIVPDDLITEIQGIEFGMFELGKKRWRKSRAGNEIIRVRCYSALGGVEAMDDASRNHLLHKALGLESLVGP